MSVWKCVTVWLLCLSCFPLKGAGVASRDEETFRWRQLILPCTVISVSTVMASNGWRGSVVNDWMGGERRLPIDDYLQYVPVASVLAMGWVAEPCHSFTERFCVTATAYASMGLLVNGFKYSIRERRPDTSARQSFPSGHTATAFMGAELVRREYGGWYGVGAYAVAAATALVRVYNNRHWPVDLIAGASIGVLSAQVGYWLLPWERTLFQLDGKGPRMTVVPSYGGATLALVF